MQSKKKMKNPATTIAVIAILVIAIVVVIYLYTPKAEPEPKLSADQVDYIPVIELNDCLEQIKQTNPAMTDQQAQDNCWAIEAVNKNNPSLCDKVSETFKDICLEQFE